MKKSSALLMSVLRDRPACRAGTLAALAIVVLTAPGSAQAPEGSNWSVEGIAGLFDGAGSRQPANSGVFFTWRYTKALKSWLYAGGQAQFRDDHPNLGRSQAFGLGPTLIFVTPTSPFVAGIPASAFYLPVGLLVEAVNIDQTASQLEFRPDRPVGFQLQVRGYVGLGLEIGSDPVRFTIEGRASYGSDGNFYSLGAGVRSRRKGHAASTDRMFFVHANQLTALNESYNRDADFRGYSVGYQVPVLAGPVKSLRGTVGVDFLEFETNRHWSTGAISFLVGLGMPLLSASRGAVEIAALPNVGFLLFSEGGAGSPVYPVAMLGLEAKLSAGGVGFLGGVSGVVANGPAGAISALRLSVGLLAFL